MAMIEYKITRHRPGRNGAKATMSKEDGDKWLAKQIAKNAYGNPARWINLEKADDFERGREDDRREIRGDKFRPEVIGEFLYNKAGEAVEVLVEAIAAYTEKDAFLGYDIHVPADYTIATEDVTSKEAAKEAKRNKKSKDKKDAALALDKLDVDKLDLAGVKDALKKVIHILEIETK